MHSRYPSRSTSPSPISITEHAAPASQEGGDFASLKLAPQLLRAIADLGFTQPTTVQSATIPRAMPNGENGEVSHFVDLMVSSQTGSGKTAAFLLPVLHDLLLQQAASLATAKPDAAQNAQGAASSQKSRRKPPKGRVPYTPATPYALVLCPTRELAQQVTEDAIKLMLHCRGLRTASIVGGMSYTTQLERLQNANLVVATPGRLLDLVRSQKIRLHAVQRLIVDEADRMLDLGFSDDLAAIHELTIERKQTLMFSATFAPRVQALGARVMRTPERITIDTPQEKHANIEQKLFWADNPQHKRKLLDHWLRDTAIDQAIVFASTQIECDALAYDLQQEGFSAIALHGALSQGLRNRRLMDVRRGRTKILVATDVAARGLDVPSITHVFNFGLPMKAEDYTHRIGRTGRAGRTGLAVTFAERRDQRRISSIEAYSQQRFQPSVIEGLEPQVRSAPARPPKNKGKKPIPHHARPGTNSAKKPAPGRTRAENGGRPSGYPQKTRPAHTGFNKADAPAKRRSV